MKTFIHEFETKIVIPGIQHNLIGKRQIVSASPGKLANTEFGRVIGTNVQSMLSFAIDYYGYIKKSDGLLLEIESMRKRGLKQIHIPACVVHFAALKIGDIIAISNRGGSSYMVSRFFERKETLVSLRWNKK